MMGQSESSNRSAQSGSQQQQQQQRHASSVATIGGSSSSSTGTSNNAAETWLSRVEAKVGPAVHSPVRIPATKAAMSGVPALPAGSSVPIGREFFQAVQAEWRSRGSRAPIPVAVPQMDPEDIIDAIADTPGDFLDPPVHLPFMIECLLEVWDEEGLYD